MKEQNRRKIGGHKKIECIISNSIDIEVGRYIEQSRMVKTKFTSSEEIVPSSADCKRKQDYIPDSLPIDDKDG